VGEGILRFGVDRRVPGLSGLADYASVAVVVAGASPWITSRPDLYQPKELAVQAYLVLCCASIGLYALLSTAALR
jgi:hypothetical protein